MNVIQPVLEEKRNALIRLYQVRPYKLLRLIMLLDLVLRIPPGNAFRTTGTTYALV